MKDLQTKEILKSSRDIKNARPRGRKNKVKLIEYKIKNKSKKRNKKLEKEMELFNIESENDPGNTRRMMILLVLDGFGLSKEKEGNAIYNAKKPVLDRLFKKCPNTELDASGIEVGLPSGQMGNSEVGHLNIGSGRIVYQELTKITKSIQDGSFFENKSFIEAVKNCEESGKNLHLMGLLSDGGVHSHIDHLYSLLDLCKKRNFDRVFIHCFLDGRDVPPMSGKKYIEELERKIDEIKIGKIISLSGRYYSMDRDNRWERIQKAYEAIVLGQSSQKFSSAIDAINESYKNNVTDEFFVPAVIDYKEENFITLGDSVIFFNFRPDRSKQLMNSIANLSFNKFKRKFVPTHFVTMTQYEDVSEYKEGNVAKIAFRPGVIKNTLGEYVGECGIKQLRMAETEKYPHVTYFFNGGTQFACEGEDRIMINSPKVPTYDVQPGMSIYELTDEACIRIKNKKYGLIIINFANCDMVGHTGNFKATVLAVEAVDFCIGRILNTAREVNAMVAITADHGNAEKMFDKETNQPHTAHTTNRVPFILYGRNDTRLNTGKISDIAPTILELMELEIPSDMTGTSLIDDN